MDKIKKLLDVSDKIIELIGKTASFLIIIIVIMQTVEVVRRYFFRSATIWNWELSLMIFGAYFMVGGSWALQEDKHVRTDVFYSKLSERNQHLIDVILFVVLFFPFMYIMVSTSTAHALWSWTIGEATHTEWGPPFYPLKITFAFSFILFLVQGINIWLRKILYLVEDFRG